MTFSKMSVRDAACAVRSEQPRDFFERYAEALNEGLTPEEGWNRAQPGVAGLSEDACRALKEFFTALGKNDAKEQAEAFALVEGELEQELSHARQRAQQGGKLRASLGVLCGAAAVVLMM